MDVNNGRLFPTRLHQRQEYSRNYSSYRLCATFYHSFFELLVNLQYRNQILRIYQENSRKSAKESLLLTVSTPLAVFFPYFQMSSIRFGNNNPSTVVEKRNSFMYGFSYFPNIEGSSCQLRKLSFESQHSNTI